MGSLEPDRHLPALSGHDRLRLSSGLLGQSLAIDLAIGRIGFLDRIEFGLHDPARIPGQGYLGGQGHRPAVDLRLLHPQAKSQSLGRKLRQTLDPSDEFNVPSLQVSRHDLGDKHLGAPSRLGKRQQSPTHHRDHRKPNGVTSVQAGHPGRRKRQSQHQGVERQRPQLRLLQVQRGSTQHPEDPGHGRDDRIGAHKPIAGIKKGRPCDTCGRKLLQAVSNRASGLPRSDPARYLF